MSTSIVSSVDAWVNKALSSTNRGQSAVLYVNGDATNTRYTYIFFPRPFELGATVFTATLSFYLSGTWSGSHTITAKRITTAWAENTITWDNAPTVTSTNSAGVTFTGGSDGTLKQITLTSMLGDVSAGGAWYGIRLEDSATGNSGIYAAENPDQTKRALLDVNWSILPEAPINLIPSGGAAISVQAPTVDWDFDSEDHTADRQQASSRVQVGTVSDFSSGIIYDSGTVANTQTNWPLTTAGTSGSAGSIPVDTTEYWRVQVVDDQGQTSAWSDTSQFIRRTKGTLTMSIPSSAGTVQETTPPITWSFTGRTQEAYEITLYEYDSTTPEEFWHLPKTTGTVTSYTLPNNLLRTGGSYNVNLRIWDTIDRQVTIGDTDYVEFARDFTYTRAGTFTAVGTLTVADSTDTDLGSAVAHLTWTYPTTPDFFSLRVNGTEVEDRILPADAFVSGTTYQFDYAGAQPATASTFEVEAVKAT